LKICEIKATLLALFTIGASMKFRREKYTREILEPLVKDSISVAQILRKLGLAELGGIHTHVSRKIKQLELDTSHFRGRASNYGERHKGSQKTPWQERLVLRQSGSRQKSVVLRRSLIESGRQYKCEGLGCDISKEWLSKPIVLEVDHINENWLDDRKENLRFLCPNCHSQTPNYCGSKGLSDVTSTARQEQAYRARRSAKKVE
jgi:hypothetical protein